MLVSGAGILEVARENSFAVPAFNVSDYAMLKGLMEVGQEARAPLIVAIHPDELDHVGPQFLPAAIAWAHSASIPVAIHLDHGATLDQVLVAIRAGFTSVMLDGSLRPFAENVAATRDAVRVAHAVGVCVEGELGAIGVLDERARSASGIVCTDPDDVERFVAQTGVDSLAVAIGTSHGAFKFKPEQCTRNADGVLVPPELRFDILAEIEKKIPEFPIVLHGASSVIPKYVKIINDNNGKLDDAVGIPEDQLRRAAKSAVCKINIDSDLRLAMTAGIREHFVAHPEHFDPRQYVADGRSYIKELVEHKIKEVLGSDGRADEVMALVNKK